jgi:RNA recognition motif-containing protein
MSARLFIANLSPDTTGDDLYAFFSKAGEVKSCQLITDRRTGRPRGFCFIEMTSMVSASTAKKQFNGKSLHGHILKVEDARPHKAPGS